MVVGMSNEGEVQYYLLGLDGVPFVMRSDELRPGWNLPFKKFAARTYNSDAKYALVIL